MTNQIVINNNPPWSLEAESGLVRLDPAPIHVTPSMMDAAILLHDPPSISEGGGIAPVSEWPGRWVDENDVIQAAKNGYGRDWFRYWHRYNRWEEVWGEGGVYERARAKMKPDDYFRVFDWNQRLLFGDYGAGKSTRFVALANHWAQHGIPTFHNGLYLGGRVVEGDEIFTLMQYMPKCSVLGHDEAHGTAPGRLAASTAVATLRGLGANIRKLNVDWSLIGAQYKDVHPMVLEECVEAMELKKVPVQIDDETLRHTEQWNNPANFVLAWNLWLDYPYKRMRERQRQSRRNRDQEEEEVEGFGMRPTSGGRWTWRRPAGPSPSPTASVWWSSAPSPPSATRSRSGCWGHGRTPWPVAATSTSPPSLTTRTGCTSSSSRPAALTSNGSCRRRLPSTSDSTELSSGRPCPT